MVRAKRRQKDGCCFFRPVGKSIAEQFGDGGTANEHKWCVVTQQGPVDKERRVQPGPEKGERRFWGASKHSPIISQRKANSSSSAVTHMYAASLAKDKTWTKTERKAASPRRPAGFYKAKSVCLFLIFLFFSCKAKKKKNSLRDINQLLHQLGLLNLEEREEAFHRLPVSSLSLFFLGHILFCWWLCDAEDCCSALAVTFAQSYFIVLQKKKGRNLSMLCRLSKSWNITPGKGGGIGAETHAAGASIVGMFIHRKWKRKYRKSNW